MGRSNHEAGKVGRAKLEVVSDAGYPLHWRSDAGLADEARRTAGVGAAFLLCAGVLVDKRAWRLGARCSRLGLVAQARWLFQ